MTPFAQALATSPELFPAALDPVSGAVTLWRLTRTDYEQSAFLDSRIAVGKPARQLPFAELARAVEEAGLPESCHFIFHIGHVGSTLLSRLLGRHPALFSVREPEVLRTLATLPEETRRDSYLPGFLKLWSRTFEPAARAVIKTTSFVSGIAADLLSRPYNPRALAMGVAPDVYLATILAGANAPAEARALAGFRLSRLTHTLSSRWRTQDLDIGELVAMGWLCEALSLAEALRAANDRMLVVDFEKFLAAPQTVLRDAFRHFGVQASNTEIDAILAGTDMRSYSKAPGFRYDTETRRAVLAEGRARHAIEIRHGLQWLERAGAEYPSIATTLDLFR